jgi:hypothetical protein
MTLEERYNQAAESTYVGKVSAQQAADAGARGGVNFMDGDGRGTWAPGQTPPPDVVQNEFKRGAAGDFRYGGGGKTPAATNNKSFINNPVGAELKVLKNENPLYFKDFYSVNIELVCASVGIPPEVAMSAYNSNFSASHAARGDWSHALNVTRAEFARQYYQPLYCLWLHIQILTNKISAPQYLNALAHSNYEVVEAYQRARWIGVSMPHIDPFKVVKAERLKLGDMGKDIPLTTVEAATEICSSGNSDSNLQQFSEELKEAERLGVVNNAAASPATVQDGNG